MMSGTIVRILLFLSLVSCSISIINATTNQALVQRNHLQNILNRLGNIQSSMNKANSDSSKLLADVERRNVIMPRICYFARVSGTSIRQKLCLPYSDKLH